MREGLVNFLNQHPSVVGLVFAIVGGWELWQALFRYEKYKQWIEHLIRKRSWLIFIGLKPAQPRAISISAALLVFVVGLVMIDAELGLLPRKLWFAVLVIVLLNLFIVIPIVKWKAWKKG